MKTTATVTRTNRYKRQYNAPQTTAEAASSVFACEESMVSFFLTRYLKGAAAYITAANVIL